MDDRAARNPQVRECVKPVIASEQSERGNPQFAGDCSPALAAQVQVSQKALAMTTNNFENKRRENQMNIVANIVIAVVGILHIGFLILEMFLWTKPFGLKTFNMTKEVAESSATLAANQGLYNGFLAAGLFWGIFSGMVSVKIFFLVCVLMAGIYGGLTAKRSILYVQALPALIGLILVYLSM